ncbi:hypothetical protein L9F63_013245 [Diploptera punctata]|uniref:DUF4378 domain-containing protein n=1 Tax=Diploptera punctata TaxID=6984 RepID=A0AAD8AC36_DIPPU|nr:hypothetical protein L9F63_013245 [Diploptera punctata]
MLDKAAKYIDYHRFPFGSLWDFNLSCSCKIDKLILEEKENAKKQVLLLNERFLHLKERTKTEIKLLKVEKREHDEICKATTERKKALRQQKAILQSYLKTIQSSRSPLSEDQIKDNRNTNEGASVNISSVVDREELTNSSSDVENKLKQISKSGSLPLPESSEHISSQVTDSHLSDTSPKQTNHSAKTSVDFSPHKEPVPEVCDLEDRAYDEFIDDLKRELQDSSSSTVEASLEQTDELSYLQQKDLSSSKGVSTETSSRDISERIEETENDVEKTSRQDRSEIFTEVDEIEENSVVGSLLEEKSIIISEVKETSEIVAEIEENYEVTEVLEKSEIVPEQILDLTTETHEKSEIATERTYIVTEEKIEIPPEVQEKSEIASEIEEMTEVVTEEKSEIITEVQERIEVATEEKSEIFTESQDNSEVSTKIDENIDKATDTQGSNEILTEAERPSVLTQIEGKSSMLEKISQPLDDDYLFTEMEDEKSNIFSEIDDRQESVTEPEENVHITSEDEDCEFSRKTEEKSFAVEIEEKSEINSDTENEAEILEEDRFNEKNEKNSEIITEHSIYDEIQSDIITKSDEMEAVASKIYTGSEIIPRSEEISEVLSKAGLQGDTEIDYETSKSSKICSDNDFKKLEIISEVNKNNIEEMTESKSQDLEFRKENGEKSQIVLESLFPHPSESIPEDQKVTETYSEDLQDDGFKKDEEEGSILEQLSSSNLEAVEEQIRSSSNVEAVEEQIKSSSKKSLEIANNLTSPNNEFENRNVTLGELEIPKEKEAKIDELKLLEERVDKTEDTSSDVISSIMEDVSQHLDEKYEESESENTKKKKLISERADRITDAILMKILSDSLMSVRKAPPDITSDSSGSENREKSIDADENKRNYHLNEVHINEADNNDKNNLIDKSTRVENITNMIFDDLFKDSAKIAYEKRNKIMYTKIVGDSSSDNSSSETERPPVSAGKVVGATSQCHIEFDVRKRIHEIMTESNISPSSREKTRPQDFMITTYDVLSPEDTPSDSPQPDLANQLEMVTSVGIEDLKAHHKVAERLSAGEDQQEWFDDDFGLSTTRKEAEELRLQQLQIEQEIQELEQAQESLPYFYFREIPNKPPPPYTPPGQTPVVTPSSTPAKHEEDSQVMPCAYEEITNNTVQVTNYLYGIVTSGGDIMYSEPPPGYYEDIPSSDSSDVKAKSKKSFKKLIFDLTREFVKETFVLEEVESTVPWEWSSKLSKRKKPPPHSKEMLQGIVKRKVLEHFDTVFKSPKEKPITRWSRKKQDFVDEILVKESHNEESDWINYEEDEVTVKNDITQKLLEKLMDETVQLLFSVYKTKFGILHTAAL